VVDFSTVFIYLCKIVENVKILVEKSIVVKTLARRLASK
jgi:hypothetical protein